VAEALKRNSVQVVLLGNLFVSGGGFHCYPFLVVGRFPVMMSIQEGVTDYNFIWKISEISFPSPTQRTEDGKV
ncbi:MAG: hypothetical protein ACO395_07900, partial [Pontimonas sp.]